LERAFIFFCNIRPVTVCNSLPLFVNFSVYSLVILTKSGKKLQKVSRMNHPEEKARSVRGTFFGARKYLKALAFLFPFRK